MPALNSAQVAKKLTMFAENNHTIIFAGAGVGSRVNLPTWEGLLRSIAEDLRRRGLEAEALLINKRTNNKDFLGAATIIRTCEELIASERYSFFSEPFVDSRVTEDAIARLEAFVLYPSAGIVTTNYDRSLSRACAKFRTAGLPYPVELNDESMRGAATNSEFILARIHGRVEVPHSIQIDSNDYIQLSKNTVYKDFVSRLLEYRSILFVGFSFADPAIKIILSIYKDAFGPSFPSKHAALIPSDADSDLLKLLRDVNIEPWVYDPGNSHHALWDGFRTHYEAASRKPPELGLPVVDQTNSTSDLHRFLAFAYTQSKTQTNAKARSLSDLIRESVVLAIISEENGGIAQKITIQTKLRSRLKISPSESESLLDDTLVGLSTSGQVIITSSGSIQLIGKLTNETDSLLEELSTTVASRLKVVYNTTIDDTERARLPKLLEDVLLTRAWDVGAFYAGANNKPSESSVVAICNKFIEANFAKRPAQWHLSLSNAVRDLFANPSKTDASKLTKLGRAAFAVQLAFASPRTTMVQQHVLPDVLYFDASIILPAIVDGHPLQKGYQSAVLRLIEANRRHGTETPRRIGSYFLDEILAHRNRADITIRELGLENNEKLQNYVSYTGASNVNVFISGFAWFRSQPKNKNENFRDFLFQCAPYSTKASLEQFLKERFQIESIHSNHKDDYLEDYNIAFNDLSLGYELLHRDSKSAVLIHHEAEQLVALSLDIKKGRRPLFVTADATLRKIVSLAKRINNLSGSIVSEVGLIGMVDLLVGLKPDTEVFTRLLWGMPSRSAEQQVRDFLINRSICSYNEALLVQMPELLDRVVQNHKEDIVKIAALGNTNDDKKEMMEFIDRIESDYLKTADKRIQEIRKQFGPGSI